MKAFIAQTRHDIVAGEQSWRVLSLGSFVSFLTTVLYFAVVNG